MRACTRRSLRHDHHLTGELRNRSWSSRRGNIIVLSVFLMILMMGMLAFSVDLGYMYTMESQLQRSVDAAALAGAGSLIEGEDYANEQVLEYLVRNPVGAGPVGSGSSGDLAAQLAQFQAERGEDLDVKMGHWDPATKTFTESDQLPSTISVSMTYANNPLFFARFLGHDRFTIKAESVAMYQPRDILVVLDFSASMNDDTEFSSIPSLTREVVEANIADCWADLGSPTYGDMQYEPQFITVHGTQSPQVSVEYRYTSVHLTAAASISKVQLTYSNGSTQYFYPNTTSIEVAGTGGNINRAIDEVRVWAGSSTTAQFFDFDSDVINNVCKQALGLNGVAYPYPSGSWNNYLEWCQSSSSQNDDHGGYRWKFGYKSLLVYWLEKYPAASQTPDLWQVSAQPVTALKNATDAFMGFIQEVDTNDRVGLAIYNGADTEGYLEHGLTLDFDALSDIVEHRQAGHYHSYTNIGGGLHAARDELVANARPGAFKMVVLMTDGIANWANGSQSTSAGRQHAIDQAQAIADLNYPIITVSLGAGADTALMQQIADMTAEGRHFNVPGGQTGQQYFEDLVEVFREIAKDRPLKLVK